MKLSALNGEDGQNVAGNPTLRAVALAAMSKAAPLIDFLEFYQMTNDVDQLDKPATAVGGSSRAINADYAGVETAPERTDAVALKIFGDKVKTDQAYERRGKNIGSERVRQLTSFCSGMGRDLIDQVFNGDNSGNSLNGLKAQVAEDMLITFDTANGGEVPLGNSTTAKTQQDKFIESLNLLIASIDGDPSCITLNPYQIARLTTIARGYIGMTTVTNVFGQKFEVMDYAGVPICRVGYKKNRASGLVLPQTETCGTSTNCSSIYAIKFGEAEDVTVETNYGLVVKDIGLVPPHYTTIVEMDLNIILQNAKAVGRMQGIKL